MLEIKDETSYKVKAYRRAAQSLVHMEEKVQEMRRNDRLYDIAGVGNGIKGLIEEILDSGTCQIYEDLLDEMGAGVLDMLKIPGLGHKAIRILHQELNIRNIEALQSASENKKIRNLPGMGIKTEQNILKAIQENQYQTKKVTLGMALLAATELLHYLQDCEEAEEASLVGSVRRGKPLVSDVDILVAAYDERTVRKWVKKYPYLQEVQTEEMGHLEGDLRSSIPFEIIIVPPEEYYQSLVWTTGSKAHRARLFQNSEREKFNGLTSEESVYEQMGLTFIPPELREDQGEIETAAKQRLPHLAALEDLQGDLHVHSTWSDGKSSLEELAEAGRKMGYAYLAITDHSKNLHIANGLDEERLRLQGDAIDKLNENWNDFRLLKGVEVDILKDGNLDLPDALLGDLDVVIASIHSYFKLNREKQTDRIIKAIRSGKIDIIGHLTGRLLQRRDPYELDVDAILNEAAKFGVALELNADPQRLDIDEVICRKAKDLGIKIALNSDAHHKKDLDQVQYGLLTARRGWLTKEDILNACPTDELFHHLEE